MSQQENQRDFDEAVSNLSAESKLRLTDGHEWRGRLQDKAELWDVLDEHGNKTGRLHERGKPMQKGDYHLVVLVWIMNSKGEFLISKRSPGIAGGRLWQQTGGSAVAGDGSLKTALKETREELGIELDPKNGQFFKQYRSPHTDDDGGTIYHVWFFKQDIDISTVKFQPEETCDAMWATKQQIEQMQENGSFFPSAIHSHLSEMFRFCESLR